MPIAYCESRPAAVQILRSRMSYGALTKAPVHTDVQTLKAADLASEVKDIVMGCPGQDISIAGQHCGFEGQRSGWVFEAQGSSVESMQRVLTDGQQPRGALFNLIPLAE